MMQIFEGSFLVVFRVKSMKEGINILLASNQVFDLWSIVFLAWEEGIILDGTNFLPSNFPPIRKFALFPLVKLSESQLLDLANELLA
jgi:hypothetical protein